MFSFFSMALLFGSMAGIIYVASKLYEDDKITIGRISTFLFYMIQLLFNQPSMPQLCSWTHPMNHIRRHQNST